MKQSEKLTQFYREYLEWVESGAPHDLPFHPGFGLCANLRKYLAGSATYPKVLDEMLMQFSDATLNYMLPFDGDIWYYRSNSIAETHHLNEKRIQWVRDHINPGDSHEAV